MTLDELLAVVDDCLYLPNKTPLYVALGTVAANLYQPPDQDPVWTLLVDSGSSGKSVLIDACAQIEGCYEATDLTIGGFISGVAGKDRDSDATGGLLRQIGARGVILNSDFTVALGMKWDRRTEFFPFLRTVYDGRVDRRLGSGGGKQLTWRGRAGYLGGVTEIIDQHQQDMAAGGERFLYYRFPPLTQNQTQQRLRFQYAGQPPQYRAMLANAFQEHLVPGRLRPQPLPKEMATAIIGLAQLAATASSPVERDPRTRELLDFGNPTRGDRLLKELLGLRWGLCYIGLTERRAWEVVAAVAISCIPRLRGRIVDYLANSGQAKTSSIAHSLERPLVSVRRALEDMECFKVVHREDGGPGLDYRWWLDPDYRNAYFASV